jgi:hypothetical protein
MQAMCRCGVRGRMADEAMAEGRGWLFWATVAVLALGGLAAVGVAVVAML